MPGEDKTQREEGHVVMETGVGLTQTGVGLTQLHSKNHQGLPATPEAQRLEHGPADTWIADFQPPELRL